MNAHIFQDSVPRFTELAKPKKRVDRSFNPNAYHIKRGALSYQITDSLNKLAQPKTRAGSNAPSGSNANVKTSSANRAKPGQQKLINSGEQSRDAPELRKKKFLLDTYARITAATERRCPRRLRELAKPKCSPPRGEDSEDFEKYYQTIRHYNEKTQPPKKR